MNTKLSLNRIKLLIQVDCIVNSKKIGFYAIIVVVAIILMLRMSFNSFLDSSQSLLRYESVAVGTYYFGCMATFFTTCNLINWRVNTQTATFLSFPASNIEKFLAFIIEFILMGILYTILFYLSALLWNCLFIGDIQKHLFEFSNSFYDHATQITHYKKEIYLFNVFNSKVSFFNWPIISWINLMAACFFCGIITFKKYAVYITLGFLYGLNLLITYTSGDFISYMTTSIQPVGAIFTQNNYTGTLGIAHTLYPYVFNIAAIYLLYIAYLKIKEKEVR